MDVEETSRYTSLKYLVPIIYPKILYSHTVFLLNHLWTVRYDVVNPTTNPNLGTCYFNVKS